MKRIVVFCGASPGSPAYVESARAFAREVARRGLGIVYGGGKVGLMGEIADAALAAGGEVVGVIPKSLADKEIAHRGLTELFVTTSMHERKARMAELGDAFVALPGGAGTMDEIFEVWTWLQIGLHDKPCALLDAHGFYRPLVGFLEHVVKEGFLARKFLDTLVVDADAATLLDRLATASTPGTRWEP